MKKTYISPISKVYKVGLREGLLQVNPSTGGGLTDDPTGGSGVKINSTAGEEETGGSTGNDLGRTGGSNIWDNEW